MQGVILESRTLTEKLYHNEGNSRRGSLGSWAGGFSLLGARTKRSILCIVNKTEGQLLVLE